MRIDFHEALTAERIEEINTFLKDYPPDAEKKRQIAAMTGRHIRTVERWFSTGQTGTRLIQRGFDGVQPMRLTRDVGDETRQRITVGLLLSGGVSGDTFTGDPKDKTGTRTNIAGVVEELKKISENRFSREALTSFDIAPLGTEWSWTFHYNQCDEGESPAGELDIKWGDDIDDDDFPIEGVEDPDGGD